MEVCPSCGGFTDVTDPITGWCDDCSRHVRTADYGTRLERWYHRNANLLDRLIAGGFSPREARAIVQFTTTKAICVRCNVVFRKGARGESLFCKSNDLCKSASRRFRYLREERRFSRKQALERVTADG